MELAYDLALKEAGRTSPNPAVGAVVVKDGRVIGKGLHRGAGLAHAEIEAFNDTVEDVNGADVYVTLEPCAHVGKTPACAEELVKRGVKRCFIGMSDPFPLVNGKGVDLLKEAGIYVEFLAEGCDLYDKIRRLNQPFLKSVSSDYPYVTAKAGVSLDGKIMDNSGSSKWVTSEDMRLNARLERSLHDAVLVGKGTVLADNSSFNLVEGFEGKRLRKVILDTDLSLSDGLNVFKESSEDVIIFTACVDEAKCGAFRSLGVTVEILEDMAIEAVLCRLKELGVQSVFVEGGAMVHGSLFDAFLENPEVVDRLLLYYSPFVVGGEDASSFVKGLGLQDLGNKKICSRFEVEKLAEGFKFEGLFNSY